MRFATQRIAGVDGCRHGWLIVEAQSDLSKATLTLAPKWHDVNSTARIIAVDMPVGLSSNGVRQCEVEARKLLSRCASRVFKTPPRGALRFAQENWIAANQWSKAQGFGGISKQAWAIRPKIKEIDALITPRDQLRILEAHPELAFARLNGGRALESKHTPEGLKARQEILLRAGFTNFDGWLRDLRGEGAKADDLFDACVLVLTARNHLRGEGKSVPAVEQRDSRGLKMAIAY